MSVRVQVILDEEEAAKFKSQAVKESNSLSAWLRDAGRKMLQASQKRQTLTDRVFLKDFLNYATKEKRALSWIERNKKALSWKAFREGTGRNLC